MSQFDILKKAGLTGADFAVLARVSRVTVHRWLHGSPVGKAHAPRVNSLLKLVNLAVEAKLLPLGKVPHKKRTQALADALRTAAPR
jgi:transcriptional regulator with XRE-family HTH domain